MAASYPSMFASGVTNAGRFDEFELYCGDPADDFISVQAADGQAIQQFQVLSMDNNGRAVPWDASEFGYATGQVIFSAAPAPNDTVTINGVVITWVASTSPTGAQATIGADAAASAVNLAAAINGTPDSVDTGTNMPKYGKAPIPGTGVTAVASGVNCNLTAVAPGVAGNAITLAEASTATTVSGANMAGGAAESELNAKLATMVAFFAVPAATPGNWVRVALDGQFNHEALVWPAGVATLEQRKRAFMGTPISVDKLL